MIAEIVKNRMESIVLEKGEFCGTHLIHAMVCKRNKAGGWSRTGKGLSCRAATWREVINALLPVLEEEERAVEAERQRKEDEEEERLEAAYKEWLRARQEGGCATPAGGFLPFT